jgi:hypothetical protein
LAMAPATRDMTAKGVHWMIPERERKREREREKKRERK